MCICFYTLEHPEYSLVLITNRDEVLSRPTLKAHWHGNDDSILSGTDVTAGGTWFGIEKATGKFALLTNVREEVTTRDRSRGKLVSDWLESSEGATIQEHLHDLEKTMLEYAGFNLLLGQISVTGQVELGFLSNRTQHIHQKLSASDDDDDQGNGPDNPLCHIQESEGFGVMSNGALACGPGSTSAGALDKKWPKMEIGQNAFQKCIRKHASAKGLKETATDFIDDLFKVLDIEFPNLKDKEDVRSTILVPPFDIVPPRQAWYATRAQTILLVERGSGNCRFIERQAWTLVDGKPHRDGSIQDWSFHAGR